jgi:ferredoxin
MAAGTPAPHDGVVYRSRGSVLIIGDSPAAADAALQLHERAPKLRIVLFAPGVAALKNLPSGITAVGGRIASLRGYLGRFSASVRVAPDKVDDAGIFSGNEDRHFDLVLDLSREPLVPQTVPPHGYYAPGSDVAALSRALDSLPQLTGDFYKPKYFDYRPQLCAHHAMGVTGCTRCLDVCAAAAIRSTGERIEVDPFLCQGCASCALACPTGALSLPQPATKALRARLDDLLSARSGGAGILVVHDAAARHLLPAMDPSAVLLLEADPLATFSDVLWLRALLAGVRGVVLAPAPTIAPKSRELLEEKVAELRAILVSLGRDQAALQIATPMLVGIAIDKIRNGAHPLVSGDGVSGNSSDEKRANILALVDALIRSKRDNGQLSGASAEPATLDPGAAFGTVLVDAEKCTLCHACTHLCPTGALSGQVNPAPKLYFKESLCVQCDLCRAGCPEKAITLQARFLPDAAARQALRELASDQLVPCSSCGTPFIGRRKLATGLALMQEHAINMPGGLDSLRMCPTCRQREAIAG